MPRNKPLVVVTRKLPEVIETRMMELFDTRLNDDDTPMDRDALQVAMAGADVLVAGSEVFNSDDPVQTIKDFYQLSVTKDN